MRISDWSSDVCSSDLPAKPAANTEFQTMRYPTNDLEHYWLPFTSNKDFKKHPRLLVEGKGVHYKGHDGNDIIDAVSGLFCSPAGHSRPEIAEAVYDQLQERSEEHTSELQSPMRSSYACLFLKKKKRT